MFVEWKKERLCATNGRSEVECLHTGHGRWLWTPVLMESYLAPSGPRRRTVRRLYPAIRSCCKDDPVVRVRWWDAMVDTLQAADGIDVNVVMPMLAEEVPLPTEEEEIIARHWPKNAPWRDKRRIDHAAAHRDRVLQEVRELLVDALRPGEKEWRKAATAWDMAETAYSFGFWDEYVRREQYGLDLAMEAIAKSCARSAPANSYADSWRTIFDEHACRLNERRAQEQTQRGAQETRGGSSSRSSSASGAQSLVERARHGSPRDCAVIIGVLWPCTPDALRHAYRDAAMRHHPDRGGDPEKMIAINIAKERLDNKLAVAEANAG